MPTVLIADDHPIVCSGIKLLLKSYFGWSTVIYEAESGNQAVELCKQHKMDMVVMDLNMPRTDPQNVVCTLIAMQREIKILILTMNKEEIFGPLYLKLGAKGFVPKESGKQELLKAAITIMNGDIYIREGMKDFYKKHTSRNDPYKVLTKRELEILRHLAKGEAIGQIARNLNLSMTTVSTHKANIFEKLQLGNLIELKSFTDIYPF